MYNAREVAEANPSHLITQPKDRIRDGRYCPDLLNMRYIFSLQVGLRGRMEAGWARMNDLIIIQASQV